MVGSGTRNFYVYPLGKLCGAEGGADKGAFNGILDENEGKELEGYPLGELLGAYGASEIGSSNGMIDGDIQGKLEGYPLGSIHLVQNQ